MSAAPRARALLLAALAACSSGGDGDGSRAAGPAAAAPLPAAPLPVDPGPQPIVNPLNLWEMMIEGGPDALAIGMVGDRPVTTHDLDARSGELLSRIGERIYQARDRGWLAMLEQEGLARVARARGLTVAQLLLQAMADLPAPSAGDLEPLHGAAELAGVAPADRAAAARRVWRRQRWLVRRSQLVAEGLDGVPRERFQLMLAHASTASPDTQVARIGERMVTRRELHLAAGYAEQSARMEYFEGARLLFPEVAGQRLLDEAARAAGVTVDRYVAGELARLPPPSRADIARFVAENPEYAEHPDRAREAVRTLREADGKQRLIERLGAAAGGVRFLLREPGYDRIPPRPIAPRRRGDPAARHVLEVLHCVGGPTCLQGAQLLRAIVQRYGDRLRVDAGDYFEGGDAGRLRNALALRCADADGRAWELLTAMIDREPATDADLLELARAAGAGPGFAACLDSERFLPLVVEDQLRAAQLGLELNIVALWIDGARLDQLGDAAHLRQTLDAALAD